MRLFAFICVFAFSSIASASEAQKNLSVLEPFIGTWTSVSGSVDGSDKFVDVARWEWAFRGNVVRITHSVNEGDYAGESLIHWDGTQKKIIYRYVTSSTFYTDGIITPKENGSIEVHEFVRGSSSGPTESRSAYWIEEGQLKAWSQFKSNGEWGERSDVIYNNTPGATVKTKAPPVP